MLTRVLLRCWEIKRRIHKDTLVFVWSLTKTKSNCSRRVMVFYRHLCGWLLGLWLWRQKTNSDLTCALPTLTRSSQQHCIANIPQTTGCPLTVAGFKTLKHTGSYVRFLYFFSPTETTELWKLNRALNIASFRNFCAEGSTKISFSMISHEKFMKHGLQLELYSEQNESQEAKWKTLCMTRSAHDLVVNPKRASQTSDLLPFHKRQSGLHIQQI